MVDTPSLSPVARFSLIIESLCAIVASCGGRAGLGVAFPTPRLPVSLVSLIWTYLRGVKARFLRYAATPPPPPCPKRQRAAAAKLREPKPLAMRGQAWLLRLIQQTARGNSDLRHFLADPEIAALIKGDRRLYRTLRPLCAALNVPMDHILKLALKPAQPEPTPAPPIPAQPPKPVPAAPKPPATPLPATALFARP